MFWARLRSFYRSVVHRSEMERNLSDELQFHLERRAEDLAARTGMTQAEAMRAARIEFGSPEKYKEETRASRGLRLVDELRSDLRFAWRSLRKNKGFAAAAIATLALGIGANTAVFSVFDAVIRDLPVSHPEQLVAFDFQRTRDSMVASYYGYCRRSMCTAFSMPTFTRFRDQTQTLSHVFAFVPSSLNVVAGGDAEGVDSLYVSGDYFAGLGVGAMLGRTLSSADDGADAQPVAVISHRYWQAASGRPALGKTVSVNRAGGHRRARQRFRRRSRPDLSISRRSPRAAMGGPLGCRPRTRPVRALRGDARARRAAAEQDGVREELGGARAGSRGAWACRGCASGPAAGAPTANCWTHS
jgi:hypothetical protein